MAFQLAAIAVREGVLKGYTKRSSLFQHIILSKKHTGVKTGVLGFKAEESHKTSDSTSLHELHMSTPTSYPAAKDLPLPDNVEDIDDSELACFSPQRARDINGSVILSKTYGSSAVCSGFGSVYNRESYPVDPHVASYDCRGALSLNSVMQTNVPEPFSSNGKSTHLNMPGGQWGQGQKYIAQDLQNSHYTMKPHESSQNNGSGTLYNANPILFVPANFQLRHYSLSSRFLPSHPIQVENNRHYCSPAKDDTNKLSRKDKLKRAIKEYGTTVIVFHVGISLLSLGGCYLAVTSGVEMGGMIQSLGPGSEVAAGAGQFVVAYAVHKILAPVRISITLASTPFIVRYLRQKGVLKVPVTKSSVPENK